MHCGSTKVDSKWILKKGTNFGSDSPPPPVEHDTLKITFLRDTHICTIRPSILIIMQVIQQLQRHQYHGDSNDIQISIFRYSKMSRTQQQKIVKFYILLKTRTIKLLSNVKSFFFMTHFSFIID